MRHQGGTRRPVLARPSGKLRRTGERVVRGDHSEPWAGIRGLRLAYRRPRMSIQGDEQDPKRLMETVPQEPITADDPSEDDQDEDVPEKDDERSRGGLKGCRCGSPFLRLFDELGCVGCGRQCCWGCAVV